MLESDPVMGWKVKPGHYNIAPCSPEGHETHYFFHNDGSRTTANDEEDDDPYDIVFIGGSFVEGFAVSDEDTFEWKLQERLPQLKIGNFGVGGHGTYQSLLLLRRLYAHNIKPEIVVYGFMPFHEDRNIAHAGWLGLISQYSSRGEGAVPICSMDERGNLVEHGTKNYPVLPFREKLALVDFGAKFYFKFLNKDERKRRRDAFEITKKLMFEMDALARQNGSEFYVAILGQQQQYRHYPEKYEAFFQQSTIKAIDCRLELDEGLVERGEGHPNELAHSLLAERIGSLIEAQSSFPVICARSIKKHKKRYQSLRNA